MAVNVANRGPRRTRRSAGPAGDPILTSKITVPEVPEWAVLRPRITGLIAEGTRWCPLTVVTGPPGAGKTMAVALWAARCLTVSSALIMRAAKAVAWIIASCMTAP